MSSSAASTVLKQALKRLPALSQRTASVQGTGAGVRSLSLVANSNPAITSTTTPYHATTTTKRVFSSVSATWDEGSEREELYGSKNGTSPISDYFNMAVQHGHTAIGPPPQQHNAVPKPRGEESTMLQCGLSEDDLTFKTSSYGRLIHAPHVPHSEHKVTLSCRWQHLPLDELEKCILAEIVGGRFNPENNELRLTSEQFGSRIENKRHLVSMLDRLVFAARKLAADAQGQGNQKQDGKATEE